MSAPTNQRTFVRIIIYVIVTGNFDRQSFTQITTIFRIQGIGRVFRVSGHEELTSATCHSHINARIFRFGKQCQFRHFEDVFPAYFRMAAMRHIEAIVKTTEDRMERFQHPMFEDSEHFLVQWILGNSVVMIQSGLRSPAYI